MFGYYKSNCAVSTAWTSLANFSWRFYTIWQHQANTLLAQMPFQREARSYAYIFTPVRFPVVGTSTCKYIYPRCWFLKACGPQHTSLLWNIQFGDCKEIRLVNSFLRSHETQCRAKCKVCDTRYAWKCWWHEMSVWPSPDDLQPEWYEFNERYVRSHRARPDTYAIMRPGCYWTCENTQRTYTT